MGTMIVGFGLVDVHCAYLNVYGLNGSLIVNVSSFSEKCSQSLQSFMLTPIIYDVLRR